MSDSEMLVFDLQPRRLKNFAEADIRTALGKRNRIAIGQHRCTPENIETERRLLTDDDLRAYSSSTHSFVRMTFDITLLPDHDCRFVMADLVLAIGKSASKDNVPLLLRLTPLAVPDGYLSSLGTGTREAGWRFERTDDANIPPSTRDLEALVVLPRGSVGDLRFRLAAKIEDRSALDKWMTTLFTRASPASADYLGLTRNLLAAGADGVVATLWPVDLEPTLRFMLRFYHELSAASRRSPSVDIAKVLRQAQIALGREADLAQVGPASSWSGSLP